MFQIYKGDCLELLKNIPDGSVDLILTDPPYKIITGGDSNGINSLRPRGILKGNRELIKKIPDFSDWLPETFRVLKNNSHAYFMINSTNFLNLCMEIEKVGFKIHNFLIWEKNNCTPSQFYMKNCEYVIFCRKGKAKYINNIGGSKTVHKINNIIGNKNHPTEKPVELMSFYINNSTKINDIILDPFMGSGSTGVAAISSGRGFIGAEIESDYFSIAEKRISEAEENSLF